MASSGDSQLDWTVSRCFRLLRPIVSRKGAMRSTGSQEGKPVHRRIPSSSKNIRAKFGHSPNPNQDPDWMNQSKKPLSRQYYAKASSSDPISEMNAGSLSIPTPMIARVRGAEAPLGDLSKSHRSESSADIFSNKFLSQSDEVNFRSQKLVQGTLDLMEATNICQDSNLQEDFFPSVGAKSLRAMCCRQYAHHIVELEKEQEKEVANERFDVPAEAYALLEETIGDIGGDYFRAVVREHGVLLFQQMVSRSLIPRAHAIALVRRMRNPQRARKRHDSPAEVEEITKTLLRAATPDRPCCSRNNLYGHLLNTIAELSSQCHEDSHVGFEFRQFSNLLNSVMPVSWLGSRRLTVLWTNTFRAFVDSPGSRHARVTTIRDASVFLQAVLALDCGTLQAPKAAVEILNSNAIPDYQGRELGCPKCPKMFAQASFMNSPRKQRQHAPINNHMSRKRLFMALNNTFSSFSAILASFAITATLRADQLPELDPGAIVHLLSDLSMDILESSAKSHAGDAMFPFARCTSILTATLITLLSVQSKAALSSVPAISINDLVRELESLDKYGRKLTGGEIRTLESLPELLYSVTRSSGKLLKSEGFDILSLIVTSLTSPSLQFFASSTSRLFLSELAFSTAQLYAERMGSKEAADLAKKIDAEICSGNRHNLQLTPFKSTPRPSRDREGLKWEEGISEWVAASPEKAVERNNPFMAPPKAQLATWKHIQSQDPISEGEETEADDFADDESPIVDTDSSQFTGLSMLLLSPDPLSTSSPFAQKINISGKARPPLSRLHRVHRDDSESESELSVSLPKSHVPKAGEPLAERSNIQRNVMVSKGTEIKNTIAPKKQNESKRKIVESSSAESDDELGTQQRSLKRATMSKKVRPVIINASDSSCASSSQEHSSFRERNTLRGAARRRNPRGTLLRSLSGATKAFQPSSFVPATQQSDAPSCFSSEEEEDELSFTQTFPARPVSGVEGTRWG